MKIENEFDPEKDLMNPIADELHREFCGECRAAQSNEFVSRVLAQAKQTISEEKVVTRDRNLAGPARNLKRRGLALASAVAVAVACLVWASVGFDLPTQKTPTVANNLKTEFSNVTSDETPMQREDFRQGAELISSGIGGTLASLDFAQNAASRLLQKGKLSSFNVVQRPPKKLESNFAEDGSVQFRDHQMVAKFTAKVLGIPSF